METIDNEDYPAKLTGIFPVTELKTEKFTISFKEMLTEEYLCNLKTVNQFSNSLADKWITDNYHYKELMGHFIQALKRTHRQAALNILEEGISMGWATWDNCIMQQIFKYTGEKLEYHLGNNGYVELMASYWDRLVEAWHNENKKTVLWKDPYTLQTLSKEERYLVPTEILDDFMFALKESLNDGRED